MKTVKIFKYSVVLVTLMLTNACNDDFFDEATNGVIPVEQAFENEEDALKAVYGIYEGFGDTHLWGDEFHNVIGSDLRFSNRGNGDARTISQLNYNPGLGKFFDLWLERYRIISRANLAFDNIQTIPDFEQKPHYLAEAVILRSTLYFDLVRMWGNVPFIRSSVTDITDESQIFLPSTAAPVIYEEIIKDIEGSLEFIPDVGPGQSEYEAGRITRDAAKAILAKIYLFRGSINESQSDFQRCFDLCSEILASKRWSIVPYFADVFFPDASLEAANRETLWKLKASRNSANTDIKIGDGWGGIPGQGNSTEFGGSSGGTNRVSRIAYHYYSPGDTARMYWTIFREGFQRSPYENVFGEQQVLLAPNYKKFTPKKDVSTGGVIDSTKLALYKRRSGRVFLSKFRTFPVPSDYTSTDGGLRGVDFPAIRLAEVYLMFAEAYNEINGSPGPYTPTNGADVTSLDAGFDPTSASAWDAVNVVRSRGRTFPIGRVIADYDPSQSYQVVGNSVADWQPGSYGFDNSGTEITLNCSSCIPQRSYGGDQEAFRIEILHERARELLGENNTRYFDLIRRDYFQQAATAAFEYRPADYPSLELGTARFNQNNSTKRWIPQDKPFIQLETIMSNVPAFRARNYLMPIPSGELEANPKMTQNPGY